MSSFWTTLIATFMFASIDLIRRLRDDLQARPSTRSLAIGAGIYAVVWIFFIQTNTRNLALAVQHGILGGLLYFAMLLLVIRLLQRFRARKQL